MTSRWILLDRDGVINVDSEDYIKSEAEWLPLPGSLEAIAQLNQAGFHVGVATNQSGVARGLYSLATLERIHQKMIQMTASLGGEIHAIAFCPHAPQDGCDCRKPKPGLLQHIANTYHFSLTGVPYIGDSFRDIKAARAVGAQPILVLSGKGAQTQKKNADQLNDVLVFNDLFAASAHFTTLESR